MSNNNMKFAVLTIIIAATSCTLAKPVPIELYNRNGTFPENAWKVSSPENQGVHASDLTTILDGIVNKNLDIHAILVIKNGSVICDRSFNSFSSGQMHDIASVTKAIMAVLIGILIDKGYLENENVLLSDIFHSHPELNKSEAFLKISVKNLLSMSSGLEYKNEPSVEQPFAESSLLNLLQSDKWYNYIAGMKLESLPGEKYNYNSINYHILSIIISHLTGMSAALFAEEYLFKPLGINEYIWDCDNNGNNYGWGNLKLNIYDLGKITYLVCYLGKWRDSRIVSEDWIKRMLTEKSSENQNPFFYLSYGYGWFIPRGYKANFIAALGRGGQCVYIYPEKDMIIITFGNYRIDNLMFTLADIEMNKEMPGVSRFIVKNHILFGNTPEAKKIHIENIDLLWGIWKPQNKEFLLEDITLEFIKNTKSSAVFRIKSKAFNVEAEFNPEGGKVLSKNPSGYGHTETDIILLNNEKIQLVINEIENINTFLIEISLSNIRKNPDILDMRLFEQNLIPKFATLSMKKMLFKETEPFKKPD